MAKPTTARVFRSIRHLDGCTNSASPIPCFTHPGDACSTVSPLGGIGDINGEPASVYVVRNVDQDGADAYVSVAYTEADLDLNLTVKDPQQARRLAALLLAGADLVELNREDDAAVHAAWAAR